MTRFVPKVFSPSEVYPEGARGIQIQRWKHLETRFLEHYGRKADFISRSPGRVNIIGEVSGQAIDRPLTLVIYVDT